MGKGSTVVSFWNLFRRRQTTNIEQLKRLAESGNTSAQCDLGIIYSFGRGVTRDFQEAAKWYRRAAEQGDAQAQYNLGIAYDQGHGVTRDLLESFRWFLAAAEGGHVEAQFNVAVSYGQGKGISRDWIEAFKWIILSDVGGFLKARAVRNVVVKQMTLQQVQEAERRATVWQPRK